MGRGKRAGSCQDDGSDPEFSMAADRKDGQCIGCADELRKALPVDKHDRENCR